MEFRFLPESLRENARSAAKYFRQNHGYSSFETEVPIFTGLSFRPTLRAKCGSSANIVCIEVMEKLRFTDTLASFVLECRTENLPVKIYLVFPHSDLNDPEFKANLLKAKKHSVGVCEILDDGKGTPICSPIPQSLAGLREIDVKALPPKFRGPVTLAVETFKNVDPVKGCSRIYDEIEALTRKIAFKADSKKLWIAKHVGTKPANFSKDPWFNICEFLAPNLNYNDPSVKPLTKQLFNKLAGMTLDRNETGHKPGTFKKLKERDAKLRSRFEEATDLLMKLIYDSKSLKP